MYYALIVVHVIFAVLLIVAVLLQSGGKGASMGAIFGGAGSQTLFGSAGPAGFLSKITTVIAVAFMVTSLTIAIMSTKRGSSSLVDKVPAKAQQVPSAPQPGIPQNTGQGNPLPAK